MTTIKLKNGSGAPLAGDLVAGEPALDLTNKRLYTEDSGGTVIEVGTNPGVDVTFADNRKALFGAGSDLQLYHDGSNSYIRDAGAGNLIMGAGAGLFVKNAALDENLLTAYQNGAVTLYYDNSAKLATTSTGIDVTGTVTADGLTVEGATLLGNGTNSTHLTLTGTANRGLTISTTNTGGQNDSGAIYDAQDTAGGGVGSHEFRVGGESKLLIAADGDISFYEDTGTTAKFFWDASAESLGIGTSSPAYPLHVWSDTTIARFGGTDTNDTYLNIFKDNASSIIKVQASKAGTGATNVAINPDGGNVGIGTDSPAVPLHVHADGTGLRLQGVSPDTNGTILDLYNSSGSRRGLVGFVGAGTTMMVSNDESGALAFQTANTERMRIDSSGTAMFKGGTTDNAIQIWESNSEIARIGGSSGTLNFLVGSTTDSRLSITSAGNVGIGTSSPSGPFHIATGDSAVSRVVGTSASGTNFGIGNTSTGPAQLIIDGSNGDFAGGDYVTLRQNNDLTGELVNVGPNALLFSTSNDEKMRIDSSGNLLVGTTQTATQLAATSSEEGMAIDNGGLVAIANSGQSPLVLNRLSSDGNIINFHRDGGTPVGSIGTHLSRIHMSAGDAGLFLDGGGTPAIWPWKSTATTSGDADAEITLGDSSNRFKDLYLSGQWVSNGSNNTVRASFQVSGTQYGYINVATTGTLYSTSSDYRLKENVVALTNATERLKQLNPLRFSFIPDQANTIVDGFLAHEVADIVPEAILGEKDAIDDDGNPVYQGIDQSKLVPLLVATIQELEARIAALESN